MTLDAKMIGLAVSLLIAWSGFLVGVIKLLLGRVTRDLDNRLDRIASAQAADADEWRRVERELMALRAALPVEYVRREDHIRNQSVIEAKLDALASELKQTRIEGAKK